MIKRRIEQEGNINLDEAKDSLDLKATIRLALANLPKVVLEISNFSEVSLFVYLLICWPTLKYFFVLKT